MISFSETLSDSQLFDLTTRPRRNRKNAAIRSLVRETYLHPHQLVTPLFIIEGKNRREHIQSMPGIDRLSIDLLIKEVLKAQDLGINVLALFPVIPFEKRCEQAAEALNAENVLLKAIRALKQSYPNLGIISDPALDSFTSHGHDGLVNEKGQILNDPTLKVLAEMSVLAAQAGADVIAPSDMMDGRVGYIRKSLDREGFTDVSILSYAAKYASSFYGPFREALNSTPQFGDKKTYQMDPGNSNEALHEVAMDINEGADMVMVKPGIPYLDIVYRVKQEFKAPTFVYHVSGEYAMLKVAAAQGVIEYEKTLLEIMISFKRAGADGILTYGAYDIANMLKK